MNDVYVLTAMFLFISTVNDMNNSAPILLVFILDSYFTDSGFFSVQCV